MTDTTFNIPSQNVVKTAADWATNTTVYTKAYVLWTSDEFYSGTDQMKFAKANGIDPWANLDYMPIDSLDNQVSQNTTDINVLEATQTTGRVARDTLAELQAIVGLNVDTVYEVRADGLNRGTYRWISGTTFTKLADLITSIYPFKPNATFQDADLALMESIIDVQMTGGDKNWRIVPFHISRVIGGLHHVRLSVFDEFDNVDASIGASGVVALLFEPTYTEPATVNGNIIDEIELPLLFGGVTSCKVIIDWAKIPNNASIGVESYVKVGFDSKIFEVNKANNYVSENEVFNALPVSQEKVFAKTNLFSLGNINNAILEGEIFGITDKTKRYGIELLQADLNPSSRSFVGIREFAQNGTALSRVSLWDVVGTLPAEVNGKRIDTITLAESGGSGISAVIKIDWAKIPTSGSEWNGTRWYSNSFTVTDGEFSYNSFKDGVSAEGYSVIDFTIDGVNSRIVTPTAYSSTGEKSKLMMHLHGNGQDYTAAGSTNYKNYCKDNNIAVITTQGQDETVAPFTTNASGWGNTVQIERYLKLYDYIQSNFNVTNTVILSCASMGGLVAGHFAYTKPFPISLCLFGGPVPDLSYMFLNGGATREAAIRNSYGMASNGSEDAQLETFIQGYDWFDMGRIDVSGTFYKTGFPRIYLYVGNNDGTFTNDFGGTAKFNEITDAIENAGGFLEYKEVVDTHAGDLVFDLFISDGVIAIELGI